jgi:hypothetical protein
MNPDTQQLIKAEQRRSDFSFISQVIQRGHIRPSTYVHEIGISYNIYEDMKFRGWINHEYYYTSKQAFFEYKKDEVVISFMHLYACEDFHHLIDRFIIMSLAGKYPVRRAGISKMNFDTHKFNETVIKL